MLFAMLLVLIRHLLARLIRCLFCLFYFDHLSSRLSRPRFSRERRRLSSELSLHILLLPYQRSHSCSRILWTVESKLDSGSLGLQRSAASGTTVDYRQYCWGISKMTKPCKGQVWEFLGYSSKSSEWLWTADAWWNPTYLRAEYSKEAQAQSFGSQPELHPPVPPAASL